MILSSSAFGGIVFQDNFENGTLVTSDTNWIANTNGVVVVDPLNASNHVLAFTNTFGGGDLFSTVVPESSLNYLSFDYLYAGGLFGGGFVGVNDPTETWLAGDCNGCYVTFSNAMDSVVQGFAPNVWQHIQIQFPSFNSGGTVQLKLEQFQAAAPNAYFDNIVLSDTGFATAAPEPGSALLILSGVAAAIFARKRLA